MTEKYRPKKMAELVAELVAKLRENSTGEFNNTATADFLMAYAADVLTAVSAELDRERAVSKPHRPSARAWASIVERAEDAEANRNRLHKAVTDALAVLDERLGLDHAVRAARILRAALDQEGGDDE